MAGEWFDRFLREREVCEMIGVHRSTLRRWVYAGLFPAPALIGPSAVRWRSSVVQEWMDSKSE